MAAYKQGRYRPTNPEKYVGDLTDIVYRSSWEHRFMEWCDLNPSVLQWNSEGIVIPYFSAADGRNRRYFVDFVVKFKAADGTTKTVLVEIKPHAQTVMPKRGRKKLERYLKEVYDFQVNSDKWEHARAWAEKNGMEFRVLTEYDLGLAKAK